MQKVENTMNKEERNKFVGVFPSWLEQFIPHIHLTAQGFQIKLRKNDQLLFDGSFWVLLFSVCINDNAQRSSYSMTTHP